ncbi:MAG: DUF4239 domain-containing protein [Deltaproteobacteria bacterium]|nr:DUF4239 domain-containing protein [Deltaproteobacteria bacterium]
MNPTIAGIIVFACTFGGALFGMWLNTVLPEHHLDEESRDTVKLGFGLIATMTALVLGLVTASAKSSFDAVNIAVKQTAVEILSLDRVLARYGPETGEIRKDLKHGIGARIDVIWPQDSSSPAGLDLMRSGAGVEAEGLPAAIRALKPRDDSQRALQLRAMDLAETLLQARWLLLAGTEMSVPMPFLVTLLFWLAITFTSFGLFAPRHATVIAVLFVCALSVGSAMFLILEMDGSFEGMIRVSADPLRFAYAHLNM